jgi:lipoyl-dependent peroxiredoxin
MTSNGMAMLDIPEKKKEPLHKPTQVMPSEKAPYIAQVSVQGGLDGRAVSSDRVLDVRLARPRELGGAGSSGTNPEQLFAAAFGAGFIAAMRLVADRGHISLPEDISVDASVGIGMTPGGFGIEVTLRISVPGLAYAEAKSLVRTAHALCPYSNATRGIDVQLVVV